MVHVAHTTPPAENVPAGQSSHAALSELGFIPGLHSSHLFGSTLHLLQLAMHFLHSLEEPVAVKP